MSKIIWQPDSLPGQPLRYGKQSEFLSASEDFVGIDGGKGSGKTDLLIFHNLRPEYLSNPRFHGVIFRREYKRLTEVIDRAQYWLSRLPQLKAVWQGDRYRFLFPSGAWLAFHNVEHPKDESKYQGWEIVSLCFDQLEEFLESQFNFLVLQNRTSDPNLKPTVRWTANPLGIGRAWIKKRFIDGFEPGKTYKIPAQIGAQTHYLTYKRIFATVFDNPVYRDDKLYIAKLAAEPDPIKRKAFFEGSWDIAVGQFFGAFATQIHVIPTRELPSEWARLGGLDYGNIKTIEILARDYDDNIYVEHEFRSEPTKSRPNGESASEFAEHSARWMLQNGIQGIRIVADVNMWSATGRDVGTERTPAQIVQNIWNEVFLSQKAVPPILIAVSKRASEEYRFRVACNEAIKDALQYRVNEKGEVVQPPKLFFLDRVQSIIKTLPSLVVNDVDPLDIADGQDDHDYDALKYAFMSLRAPDRPKVVKQYTWGDFIKEKFEEAEKRASYTQRAWYTI